MAVNVDANVVSPSHTFSLDDGSTKVGFITCDQRGRPSISAGWRQAPMPRTAMKMAQGSEGYEDFELPFTSIEMKDWSGGMNAENFEDDRTRYRTGRYADTTRGDIICGPKVTTTTSLSGATSVGDITYDTKRAALEANIKHVSEFIPSVDRNVYAIRCQASGAGTMAVYIYSNNGGSPGTLLGTGQFSVSGPGIVSVPLTSTTSLTAGTTYFIGYYLMPRPAGAGSFYYTRSSTGKNVWAYNGSNWYLYVSNQTVAFSLTVGSLDNPAYFKFFEYRRCLYAVANFDDNTTPKLYRNGYRGAASTNSSDKMKLNTDQDLSGASLEGCIALIIDGPGMEEEQPWRIIVSNTTTGSNDSITVETPWKVTHTSETSWVVIGSNDWTEITGHGFGGRIRDVEIVKDYVMFAQGDSVNIRKMREYNNAGTWTTVYADDGTNKADLLLVISNTEGVLKLWKALVDDNEIKSADVEDWGTGHTFGDAIVIGNSSSRINGMIAYGEPRIPYVFKEDSFGSISNDIYAEVPIGEMSAIRSEYNGTTSMTHGVYLYFNMGEKIERYYDRRLDDVGPDDGEGMPSGRSGIVRKLLPYPGRYYALLYTDGNVPSILCHNGYGWHEIWRATETTSDGSGATGEAAQFAYNVSDIAGQRSNDMVVQVVPGETVDRLWFGHNGQIKYIPITINPRKDRNYEYADLAQITTAWIYGNLKDVKKYWHSIKLHTEELSGTARSIKVEYQTDSETDWTTAGYIDTSPIEELDLSSSYNVTGYRIRFRLTLNTDGNVSPRIVAIVIKGVIRVDVKKGWTVRVLTHHEYDLSGRLDEQGNIAPQLDTWANSDDTPSPLILRHNLSYYDNKYVFIDPASLSYSDVELEPTKGQNRRRYTEIATFTMYEV